MSKIKSKNHTSNLKSDTKYRSYCFSIDIINFVKTLPNERIYWTITDQLLRSATSIGANLIEAKAASSKRDFMKFVQISLKSANEAKYWLCLLRDAKLINKSKTKPLIDEVTEIANMLGSSILTLKGKNEI